MCLVDCYDWTRTLTGQGHHIVLFDSEDCHESLVSDRYIRCSWVVLSSVQSSVACSTTYLQSFVWSLVLVMFTSQHDSLTAMWCSWFHIRLSVLTLDQSFCSCVFFIFPLRWRWFVSSETCPDGWRKFGCSCYFLSTTRITWQGSRQQCVNQGAGLVIIKSRREMVRL